METTEQIERQRRFFDQGATWPLAYRLTCLEKLRDGILAMRPEIEQALQTDLGKSAAESYMTEIGMVLSEISYMRRHLRRFIRPRRVRTPLAQFPAKSYELPVPYGTVLIMSPWNYPFMLSLEPAVDALAAGNTVILKPSAYSPATSEVLCRLCEQTLPPELLTVVTGGREVNVDLLEQRYDYIFFTGGKTVGRLVMEKAARHLTPVTLELGGKSPCIVDETADLKLAARRIVFGKFLNLGQTCVAPDYVLVQESVRGALLGYLGEAITAQFGRRPLENPDYGHIVNRKHFERLAAMLPDEHIAFGGDLDEAALRMAPTVLDRVSEDSRCMQEEIFGPILPVLAYRTWEEARQIIARHPTPLALYLFTSDGAGKQRVLRDVRFGGGCVNDTIIHLATSRMGFGGVGESGMGSYHGKYGFDTFTHRKSMVDKKTWLDLPMRYQPYDSQKQRMIETFLK